jgi:hypothetical protein
VKLVPATDVESYDFEDDVLIDEDSDEENNESNLVDSLPQDSKISVVENRPAYEGIWVAAEIVLLAGQIALTIFALIKTQKWRSIAVAGHVQWVYLLIIALLRLLGTKRTLRLWTHSISIYLFSWPIAFILLRSAILDGGQLELQLQIANICLVTGLCGLILTSRAENRPAKLVSTHRFEPTRVRLATKMLLRVGTHRKYAFTGNF